MRRRVPAAPAAAVGSGHRAAIGGVPVDAVESTMVFGRMHAAPMGSSFLGRKEVVLT